MTDTPDTEPTTIKIVPGFAASLDILATVLQAGTEDGKIEAAAQLVNLGRFMDRLAEAEHPAFFMEGGRIAPAPELITPAKALDLCETAACLWEAAMDFKRPLYDTPIAEALRAAFRTWGAASVRVAVCELAADCLAAWEALPEDDDQRGDAFDADWCPRWLADNLDQLAARLEAIPG